MGRGNTWHGAASVLALLILSLAAQAEEAKVTLGKVPKPVLDAVKARFNGARMTGAAKEAEDGKFVYEITLKDKGQNIDVTLTPEGAILLIEKETARKDLPKPAAAALEEKYPRATYKIVEEIFRVETKQEKLAYYEVLLVTPEKNVLEVQVTAEGKIINEEKKDSDKDGR